MLKKCPFCESTDVIFLGTKMIGAEKQGAFGCRSCFKVFLDEPDEDTAPAIHYNPKFKQAYLNKKIPEMAEHAKFKFEDKLTLSDVTDLKIAWWEMKKGKTLEELLND